MLCSWLTSSCFWHVHSNCVVSLHVQWYGMLIKILANYIVWLVQREHLERQQGFILSKCHIIIYMHIKEFQNIVCMEGTQINFQKCSEVKPCHINIIIVVMGRRVDSWTCYSHSMNDNACFRGLSSQCTAT